MENISTEDSMNPVTVKADHPAYHAHINRYFFASTLCSNKKALDTACGAGHGSRIIADSGAKVVIGADISSDIVKYAISKYTKNNITFVNHDVSLEFDDEFDVVVSFETIEHVVGHIYAMEIHYAATKTGGLLIISSPNRSITNPYLHSYTPCNDGGHIQEFKIGEFRELFTRIGYTGIGLLGQLMQQSFRYPFLEKHYKRIFKTSRKSSPKVSQEINFQPENFFVLAKSTKPIRPIT